MHTINTPTRKYLTCCSGSKILMALVILATNMKNNIDDAFIRRFNAIIQFQVPGERERAAIWQKTFLPNVKFQDEEDIPGKSEKV